MLQLLVVKELSCTRINEFKLLQCQCLDDLIVYDEVMPSNGQQNICQKSESVRSWKEIWDINVKASTICTGTVVLCNSVEIYRNIKIKCVPCFRKKTSGRNLSKKLSQAMSEIVFVMHSYGGAWLGYKQRRPSVRLLQAGTVWR